MWLTRPTLLTTGGIIHLLHFNIDLMKNDSDTNTSNYLDALTSHLFVPHIVGVVLKWPMSKKSKIEIFTVSQVFVENFDMTALIYDEPKKNPSICLFVQPLHLSHFNTLISFTVWAQLIQVSIPHNYNSIPECCVLVRRQRRRSKEIINCGFQCRIKSENYILLPPYEIIN